jgi:hypothetical protein
MSTAVRCCAGGREGWTAVVSAGALVVVVVVVVVVVARARGPAEHRRGQVRAQQKAGSSAGRQAPRAPRAP